MSKSYKHQRMYEERQSETAQPGRFNRSTRYGNRRSEIAMLKQKSKRQSRLRQQQLNRVEVDDALDRT